MENLIILFHKGKKMLMLPNYARNRLSSLAIKMLALFGALCACVSSKNKNLGELPVVDINQKNPTNLRSLRSLQLKNGLEVLLVTDPNMNKSSAALDVRCGSLANPKEHEGLAHFLEHMLFLGTKKYPDTNEYNTYLAKYQGHSNAYTASEHTNYHFEVNHDGLEGALDRFAQFFIRPQFNPEYVNKEREAVHSEHQKNLKNDYWRFHRLVGVLHKKGHPESLFSTGDRTTLGKTTREVLVDFYQKHYSANLMKLVLMSNKSLDTLESWTKKMFLEVPNYNLAQPSYDREIFDTKDLPRWVEVKPVKNYRKLILHFASKSSAPYWKTKPTSIIGHLLGHEGRRSLLSLLKKENLATELSAGHHSESFAGLYDITLSLTEKGLKNPEQAIQLFFSYIEELKTKGLSQELFQELKAMSEINYVYRDQQEGMGVSSWLASQMHFHPGDEVEKRASLFYDYSNEDFKSFLEPIKPENMTVLFVHPEAKTNKQEKYYKTAYSVEKIDQEKIGNWMKPKVPAELSLPLANEFIPKKLKLLSSETNTKPKVLFDNEWGKVWFQQDDQYKLPKAYLELHLLSPKVNQDAKSKALSLLYDIALNEGLNEWNYEIGLAGLHYILSRTDKGIQIDVSGYSENLPQLVVALSEKLQKIDINEKIFASLKEKLKRDLENAHQDTAYKQLLYELRYLTKKHLIHRDEIYSQKDGKKIDLISPISLEEVKDFAKNLYTEIGMEAVAYGSIDESKLKESISSYPKTLKSTALAKNLYPEDSLIHLKGSNLRVISKEIPNHCWARIIQVGDRSSKLDATMQVMNAYLETNFFNELRTNQQLGYIVWSGPFHHEKVMMQFYLIQSADYDPYTIWQRVSLWHEKALQSLKALPEKELKIIKDSVIEKLRKKERTMSEKHDTLVFEALKLKGQFAYNDSVANQVGEISKEDIMKTFAKISDHLKQANLSVFLQKKEASLSHEAKSLGKLIENPSFFKKEALVY